MTTPWMTVLRAIVASFAIVAVTPDSVAAQFDDCGTNCRDCGEGKKEGYSWHADGQYNMNCLPATTGCVKTGCGAAGLVNDAPKGTLSLALVSAAPGATMNELIRTSGLRLLVYPARNMVALRGDRCAENKIVAVMFLPPAQVSALAKAGARSLEEFLAKEAKGAS